MDQKRKALMYAIAEYLTEQKDVLDSDGKDSIEVAVQCIETTYDFVTGEEEAKARYSEYPNTLMDIYEAGKERLGEKSTRAERFDDASPPGYNETEDMSQSAPSYNRAQADQFKEDGNQEFKAGKYSGAVMLYTEAIAVCPDVAVYYVNRAAAYTKLGENDKAVQDCLSGIALDETYHRAHSRLGTAYFAQQKWQEAVKAYQRAVELDPTNASYMDNLRAAEEKLRATAETKQSTTSSSEIPRGAGAPGGGLDVGSLLNNPALMGMAQQFLQSGGMQQMMSNPAFQNMAQMMQGQGGARPGGAGGPSLAEMMNDPNMMNAARELQKQFGNQGQPPN